MSRKHHKSKFKSKKAKTVAGSNYMPSCISTQNNTNDTKPITSTVSSSSGYTRSNSKFYKSCHDIIEIYQNFFLMAQKDEDKFVKQYNPDVIVPLAGTGVDLYKYGFRGEMYYYPCPDYGTLPEEILNRLVLKVVSSLTLGLKVGMYCLGGHGRTGYVAAAILGILGVEDPINLLWTKYCTKAIETKDQLKAVTDYLQKPELYEKYKNKIHDGLYGDFGWGSGWYSGFYTGANYKNYKNKSYGSYSDWGYTGTLSTTTTATTSTIVDTKEPDEDSIIGLHYDLDDDYDSYYDKLIQKAALLSENYSFEDEEPIDEGRVLTPTEIQLLKDDSMWSCSESTLENLHGEQLQEAFDYLRDVYGIG